MGRKPKVTVTARVRTQTRVQLRTQHVSRTSAVGWSGPVVPHQSYYYGDSYEISGEQHQVAIGVSGGVTQISSGAAPVDVEKLSTALEQLLDLLDNGQLQVDDPDGLREVAEEVLDEADSDEPDHSRLRAGGRAVLGRVGTAAAGGTIAQLLGQAVLAALS